MKYFEINNLDSWILFKEHTVDDPKLCTVYHTDATTDDNIKMTFEPPLYVNGEKSLYVAQEMLNMLLITYLETYTPYVIMDYGEITDGMPILIVVGISEKEYARTILLNDGIHGNSLRYDDIHQTIRVTEVLEA